MSELTPCPFCGCAMRIISVGRDWYRYDGTHSESCPLDHATMPDFSQSKESLDSMIADWNTRYNEKAPKLDVPYFEINLKIILRDIKNYTSDEMVRALQRLSDIANQ